MKRGLGGRKKEANRHLGRGKENKQKKEVRQLVVRVQGGLTLLQGPERSGAAVLAPYYVLAIQVLLVSPQSLGGYAGHHVGRDLLRVLKVGHEVLNVWECIQVLRLKYESGQAMTCHQPGNPHR